MSGSWPALGRTNSSVLVYGRMQGNISWQVSKQGRTRITLHTVVQVQEHSRQPCSKGQQVLQETGSQHDGSAATS